MPTGELRRPSKYSFESGYDATVFRVLARIANTLKTTRYARNYER